MKRENGVEFGYDQAILRGTKGEISRSGMPAGERNYKDRNPGELKAQKPFPRRMRVPAR
jgi:hypothetical protein